MPSTEERMLILRMVEEGKITPEDGARLLAALGQSEEKPSPAAAPSGGGGTRYFRVRVSDNVTGRQKVNVNLPVGLVNFALRFVPPDAGVDVQSLRDAIQNGLTGRIVDVTDDEDGNRVEVFVD